MNDNENIRVANIIEEGRLGGPQIRIAEVAKRLKEKGIETTVIYPRLQSETFQQRLEKYGIPNIRLPLHRLTKDKKHLFQYFLFFFYELFVLYRFLKKERFDIIHCSGGAWQHKGVIAGKMAGIKTLWHLNDTYMPQVIKYMFNVTARFFTDGFIVSCNQTKLLYLSDTSFNQKPIFEILPPVDTDKFFPEDGKKDSKIEMTTGLAITTVANINPLKGLEYFIQMAHQLTTKYDNLVFFIVGSHFKSQEKYSKKLYDLKVKYRLSNLHFYGSCEDVKKVLKSSDIYVCSSIAESGPISLFEAMSMEKPVVTTNVGDVTSLIRNGINGFIVPKRNSQAIAHHVEKLIQHPELRELLGKSARKTAIDLFDTRVAAKKHVKAYLTMCCKNTK